MTHYLGNEKIENEDMLNLINEREKIEVGTEVVWETKIWGHDDEIKLKAVEVNKDKTVWEMV
jgi:hypothetical protein